MSVIRQGQPMEVTPGGSPPGTYAIAQPTLLTEPCKVCGAAPGVSCPTEAEPLCSEMRPDGSPCIRSLGHGPGHRATCLPGTTDGSV